jgi:hypothetical protein
MFGRVPLPFLSIKPNVFIFGMMLILQRQQLLLWTDCIVSWMNAGLVFLFASDSLLIDFSMTTTTITTTNIEIDDKEILWILAMTEEKICKYTKENAANNLRKLIIWTANSTFRHWWTNWNPQCFFILMKNFHHEPFRIVAAKKTLLAH